LIAESDQEDEDPAEAANETPGITPDSEA